jgi:predicted dinucleotide-binding enzyme
MSTITIIGTGNMARGLAARSLAGGTDVQILAHDDEKKAVSLAEELAGTPRSGALGVRGRGSVSTGTVGDPVNGDLVVFAVPYAAVAGLVRAYRDELAGRTVVDITNPLNDTMDDVVTAPGRSAAEEIAASLPAGTPVVKAFNTIFAGTLVLGEVAGQPLDVFVAGDDADAKARVVTFVESAGLRPVDVGPLARARLLESLALLHIGLQFSRGTRFSTAIKVLD